MTKLTENAGNEMIKVVDAIRKNDNPEMALLLILSYTKGVYDATKACGKKTA